MKKINLGCGNNRLDGWENHDIDVDITKTLPYQDEAVDLLFIEHCVEHITHREAFRFFQEVRRVLKKGGTFRIVVPSVVKVAAIEDPRYFHFINNAGWGAASKEGAVEAILFQHGHQCIWSMEAMLGILNALGFAAKPVEIGESENRDLVGVEGHGKIIGNYFNGLESIAVEAIK